MTSRSSTLATVSALFAVTALLLWPTTAAAAHGPKKVPPGQAKKLPVAPAPGPVTTRTVVVVRVVQAPAPAPSPASRPRLPAPVTQPVTIISAPPAVAPIVAAPVAAAAGSLGPAPIVARPPVSAPEPPELAATPGAVTLILPYQAVGVGTGALALALLLALLIALRRRRLGASQLALARELGLRPRQLATVTAGAAEVALGRLRSGRVEAMQDDLTGVLRRGPGMAALEREIARAHRSLLGRLVVAFIDVDGLKEVNDTQGHAAGDQLLRAVAAALVSRLRGQDAVLRYGGDEFVAVLPDTDLAGARQTMLEIRARLADRLGRKPFSVGLAVLRQGDTARDLVQRADAALYESRRLGLN